MESLVQRGRKRGASKHFTSSGKQLTLNYRRKLEREATLRERFRDGRQSAGGEELMRCTAFVPTLQKCCVDEYSPTHEMHTPYRGGTWLSVLLGT